MHCSSSKWRGVLCSLHVYLFHGVFCELLPFWWIAMNIVSGVVECCCHVKMIDWITQWHLLIPRRHSRQSERRRRCVKWGVAVCAHYAQFVRDIRGDCCASVPYRRLRLTDVIASGSCCSRPHWALGSLCVSHPPPSTLTGRFQWTGRPRPRYITTLRNRFRLPVVTVVHARLRPLSVPQVMKSTATEHRGGTKTFQRTEELCRTKHKSKCGTILQTRLQLWRSFHEQWSSCFVFMNHNQPSEAKAASNHSTLCYYIMILSSTDDWRHPVLVLFFSSRSHRIEQTKWTFTILWFPGIHNTTTR